MIGIALGLSIISGGRVPNPYSLTTEGGVDLLTEGGIELEYEHG